VSSEPATAQTHDSTVVPFQQQGSVNWSALAVANTPIDPTGVLFNAADPSGKLQGKV
jgi:hypothetical protein